MSGNRAWIYCRVDHSGSESAELIAIQKLQVECYAREYGLEVTGFSNDIGSGLIIDRPGLRAFLDAVEDGNVDVLLLFSLTRLGRDMDQVTQFWQTLRGRDVRIYTVMEGEIDLGFRLDMLQYFAGKVCT